MDSNDCKQWFAQGYVAQTAIAAAAKAAREATDRDLVIALVHHHVLPIAKLEEERGGEGTGFKLLPNVTGLLNSGSLLSHLSAARVDLVLHGHEHMRNQARCGSLEDGASNTVVLAAGSATGAETGGDFQLSRVHFNVLELREDRSMWLREVGLRDGTLDFMGERRLLLTPGDIRQSRFVRRNRLNPGLEDGSAKAFPRSRIKKLLRFSETRDVEITETRTHWAVGKEFTQLTRNTSGQLSELVVECQWLVGPLTEYRGTFLPQAGGPDRFVGAVNLDASGQAERITSSWIWYGGGVLTESDLKTLPGALLDPIRAKET